MNDEDFTEVRNDLLKDQKEKTTTQQQLMYKIEQGTKKKLEKTGNDMISKIFDRKVVERIQLEFNKRQGCAWFNIDKEQINTLNKVSTPQDEGKLYISYGNHAFDWNYDFETLMMTKYNPWKLNTVLKDTRREVITKKKKLPKMPSIPILSTYTDKGIKIAFLDFDMTLLLCADKMEDAVK